MPGEGFIFDSINRMRENHAMKSKHGFSLGEEVKPYDKDRFSILQKRTLSEEEIATVQKKVSIQKQRRRIKLLLIVILSVMITGVLIWFVSGFFTSFLY